MLERMEEQAEAVIMTLCLLGKNNMCLTTDEINIMRETITILRPFEKITTEMSADLHVSISRVIFNIRTLRENVMKMSGESISSNSGKRLLEELNKKMTKRFLHYESNFPLAAATLLDPRLKKIPFVDDEQASTQQARLVSEMKSNATAEASGGSTSSAAGTTEEEDDDVWSWFSKKAKASESHRTQFTEATVETDSYMKVKLIGMKENPLAWWKEHAAGYPLLAKQAKKYLCAPATSVPAERLYSKAGELISEKRNRLKDKHVNMYLFVNKNL
uniref:E3 SUMO-protein ligase ZBED1-like n=1 Tax=Myxine glutinosa TaxID=7769 RepID=UPI0035902B98